MAALKKFYPFILFPGKCRNDKFFDSNQLNHRPEKRIGTFWQASLEGDSLVLSNYQTIRYLCIIRGKKIYSNPENGFELKKGDKLIVCIRKLNFDVNLEYVAFAAYTIISISEFNNIRIDYTHQFYDRSEPYTLKNHIYTTILMKYIEKFLPNFPEKCKKPLNLKPYHTNWMKNKEEQTRRRVCSFLL